MSEHANESATKGSMELAGRRVLVMGMARSGVATLRLLRARNATPFACDLRPASQLGEVAADVQSLAESFLPQSELEAVGVAARGFQLVVLSPGVPADLPLLETARRAGIPVIGEVELAARFLLGPIIGITGTNGKTTTTALAGHLLRAAAISCQVGGNIGTPVCDMVTSSRPDQWNVLELSSFQLETSASLRSRIAVCLNVTPDHLDRHHTFENYSSAKRRLFEMQEGGSHAVLNQDDATCRGYTAATPAEALTFSASGSHQAAMRLEGDRLLWRGNKILHRAGIPLPGLHNVENVMAAALAALLAGATPGSIAAGVASFPGVEHRLEFVRERRGVRWVNDSKATNVDAALKAVAAFDAPLWVILGGKDKNGDYRPLGEALRGRARQALLIGNAASKIREHISSEVPCAELHTLPSAVSVAAQRAQAGDVVLLAPACASFDQFDNFEHRGKVFKDLVAALPEDEG